MPWHLHPAVAGLCAKRGKALVNYQGFRLFLHPPLYLHEKRLMDRRLTGPVSSSAASGRWQIDDRTSAAVQTFIADNHCGFFFACSASRCRDVENAALGISRDAAWIVSANVAAYPMLTENNIQAGVFRLSEA